MSDAMDVSERHSMDVSERYAMDVSERYTNSPSPSPPRSYHFNHHQHRPSEGEDSNMSINRSAHSDPSAHLEHNRSDTTTSRSHENPVQRAPIAEAAAPPEEQLFDAPAQPEPVQRPSMTSVEQARRRASIKHIMADPSLSQIEKRRSIQCLMDGRKVGGRRSTIDSGMTNPYMAAKAERLRRGGSFRRSSSSNNLSASLTGAAEAPLVDADDLLPITSNTRHFSYNVAAAAASSSITSNSYHGDNNSNNNSASNSNNNSSHSYQDNSNHNGQSYLPHENNQDDSDDSSSAASSNLLSAFLQKKHPYNATTTKVPAVAAEASSSPPPTTSANNTNRRGSNEFSRRAIEMAPTCTHYSRNCHIVSPCCGATFGCRICHDDCPVLPPLLEQKMPSSPFCPPVAAAPAAGGGGGGEDDDNYAATGRRKYQRVLRTSSMPTSFTQAGPPEHHNVDRFAIREIICRKCYTKQGSKTNNCINCGMQFGEYHCAICNLWMSNEEKPYHCPDCGFCRVGGGENFRHCQDCGMCIDKQLFQDHNCKVGKYMSNCPVCQEDLFSSRDASHELPCGHAIHWHCFRELASHDSRCPMCKKTAETHERMKPTWDAMAMGIALQPVPPELAKVVTIKCNDCEIVTENRSWHFLGVRCNECESFNTVVERITMMGQEAHEFLLRMELQQLPARAGEVYATAGEGGGGGQQQQGATSSRRSRPARRRRATVDSAVNPWANRQLPER
mmetsp:Transcript_7236/g.11045  ORF Transcript_7236/g.11045 Transcript_7236/m.11045 type:complete len:730 (+) Transcript_7236:161-2350(+)